MSADEERALAAQVADDIADEFDSGLWQYVPDPGEDIVEAAEALAEFAPCMCYFNTVRLVAREGAHTMEIVAQYHDKLRRKEFSDGEPRGIWRNKIASKRRNR